MTPEQYDRWKEFALRMAKTCYKGHRHPSRKEIVAMVEDFIGGLCAEDIPCIRDWDNSEPYPEGSRLRRAERSYPCGCGKRGKPLKGCRACRGTGTVTKWAKPYCMGDMMSKWETDRVYYHVRDLMSAKEL